METWKEVYKGIIPKDIYKTWITNSEEKGLNIELRGNVRRICGYERYKTLCCYYR